MDIVYEFVSIDGEFFKIIQSWELLETPMKNEHEIMIKTNDLEKAEIRNTMLKSLEKIIEICKDQRICMATVAKEYSIDVSNYNGEQHEYDPIDVLTRVFEENYFKNLCEKLDKFVEKVDTEEKFEKKTYDFK